MDPNERYLLGSIDYYEELLMVPLFILMNLVLVFYPLITLRDASHATIPIEISIIVSGVIIMGCAIQMANLADIGASTMSQPIGNVDAVILFCSFLLYCAFTLLFVSLCATLLLSFHASTGNLIWTMSNSKYTNYHYIALIVLLVDTMSLLCIASDIFNGMSTAGIIIFVFDCDLTMYFFIRNLMAIELVKTPSKDDTADIINVSILFLVAVCSSLRCVLLCHDFGLDYAVIPIDLWTMDSLFRAIATYFNVNGNDALRSVKQCVIFSFCCIVLQIATLCRDTCMVNHGD